MERKLSRREMFKRSGVMIAGGFSALSVGLALDEPLKNVEEEHPFDKTEITRNEIDRKDGLAKVLIIGGGVSAIVGGFGFLNAADDNVPFDDEGNPRSLMGYTDPDHMLGLPIPIYENAIKESVAGNTDKLVGSANEKSGDDSLQ